MPSRCVKVALLQAGRGSSGYRSNTAISSRVRLFPESGPRTTMTPAGSNAFDNRVAHLTYACNRLSSRFTAYGRTGEDLRPPAEVQLSSVMAIGSVRSLTTVDLTVGRTGRVRGAPRGPHTALPAPGSVAAGDHRRTGHGRAGPLDARRVHVT